MRKNLNVLILFFCFAAATAQKSQPVEIKDKDLVRLLGSISTLEKYTFGNSTVTVIKAKAVGGPSRNNETDEVADNLYITNCSAGEGLDCRVYALKDLMALAVNKVYEENGQVKVAYSYGNASDRKSDIITVPSK